MANFPHAGLRGFSEKPQDITNFPQSIVSRNPQCRGESAISPMKALLLTALCCLPLQAAQPPAADREAILAMAGTYHIDFRFQETVAIDPEYDLVTKPYTEEALEVVKVVENTPERIALQHLLVVEGKEGKPMVIKHWAQIWTWQDTHILDYSGEEELHEWDVLTLSAEEAAGTWSQLVTQIDDSPRYEGFGKWTHARGESSWESSPTRRPLPRREYTVRDDYDYLLGTNRHTLTKDGWVHFQDNRKVVDRGGEDARVLCFEAGLNTYTRRDSELTAVAEAWWEKHGDFWDGVRAFWTESGERAPTFFAYTESKNGETLGKLISRLEKDHSSPESTTAALAPFIIAK
jgi:hypothetical protein